MNERKIKKATELLVIALLARKADGTPDHAYAMSKVGSALAELNPGLADRLHALHNQRTEK